MADKVRFLAVARVPDKTVVATFVTTELRDLPRALMEEKVRVVLSSGRMAEHRRLTITDKDCGSIHYDSDAACLYMAVTQPDYPQRSAFKLLNELQRRFEENFGMELGGARELQLSRRARALFADVAAKYQDSAAVDKVANVALQVEEVKGVMQNNINAVLKNQENLETLLTDTDAMRGEASVFHRSAVRTKDRMWWKNFKLMIAIILLVSLLAGVITASVFFNKKEKAGKTSP